MECRVHLFVHLILFICRVYYQMPRVQGRRCSHALNPVYRRAPDALRLQRIRYVETLDPEGILRRDVKSVAQGRGM